MYNIIFFFSISNLILCSIVFAADVILQLPNGLIRGRTAVTQTNLPYYVFQKIPYAAPPIGDLRFKAPVPPENWDGILNTTQFDVMCYQMPFDNNLESEDCLYLNVYTPTLPDGENDLLPVMFYIYGGGFVQGDCLDTSVGPEYLIDRGVIVITINYRVGPFGFLSTEDLTIPGNNGLKDQHLAIQWAHDNVQLFGGDPSKITIFGQSAGAASVTYQFLNSKSEGLFRGAICESGSFLNPWSYQRNSREIAFQTASFINETFATNNNSQELLEFLLSVPAKDIDDASYQISLQENYQNSQLAQGFFYAPVVEPEHDGAFLTQKMYGALKDGNIIKVPILIGVTSEESIFYAYDLNNLQNLMEAYDANPNWTVPNDMRIQSDDIKKEIGASIISIYAEDRPLASDPANGIRYSSDNSFTRGIIKHAELQSKYTPVYFYQFSYHGLLGFNTAPEVPGAERVGHSEELMYLWRIHNGNIDNSDLSQFPEQDVITQHRMLQIWTDFVKELNPTPQPTDLLQNITWPLVSLENGDFLYVDIGENLEIKNHPKEASYGEWNDIYSSLGYDDFDTY